MKRFFLLASLISAPVLAASYDLDTKDAKYEADSGVIRNYCTDAQCMREICEEAKTNLETWAKNKCALLGGKAVFTEPFKMDPDVFTNQSRCIAYPSRIKCEV